MLNHIISSSSFMTLGTTLLTTILIVYRIRSVMLLDRLHSKRSPFQNILELIVQSAAPYAVASLVYAIVGAIPITMESEWKLFIAQAYPGVAFLIIAVCFSHLCRRENILITTVLLLQGNCTNGNGGERGFWISRHGCTCELGIGRSGCFRISSSFQGPTYLLYFWRMSATWRFQCRKQVIRSRWKERDKRHADKRGVIKFLIFSSSTDTCMMAY